MSSALVNAMKKLTAEICDRGDLLDLGMGRVLETELCAWMVEMTDQGRDCMDMMQAALDNAKRDLEAIKNEESEYASRLNFAKMKSIEALITSLGATEFSRSEEEFANQSRFTIASKSGKKMFLIVSCPHNDDGDTVLQISVNGEVTANLLWENMGKLFLILES